MDDMESIARWSGELLWPQELVEASIIDLSGVTALGSWAHAWFAARPGQGVAGAHPRLRAQLDQAGVGVCWRDPTRIIAGVTRSERQALFADELQDTVDK
jgi:hypothetical protein